MVRLIILGLQGLETTKLKDSLQLFSVKISKLKTKCPRSIFLMYSVCQSVADAEASWESSALAPSKSTQTT